MRLVVDPQLFGMVGNGLKAARCIKVEPASQPHGLDIEEGFKSERDTVFMIGGISLVRHE